MKSATVDETKSMSLISKDTVFTFGYKGKFKIVRSLYKDEEE